MGPNGSDRTPKPGNTSKNLRRLAKFREKSRFFLRKIANIFAFFREFLQAFASFWKCFKVSECVRIHLDPYGPTRMRWDASRCVRKRSDVVGNFPIFSDNFDKISDFGAGRACAIYRRSPKCALSSHLVVCCLLL